MEFSTNNDGIKFYGSGTNRWIGIIASNDSQKVQIEGTGGFGIRRKVRIMGCHPFDDTITDSQLTYAFVSSGLYGTGAANCHISCSLTQGDVVYGTFTDGFLNKQTLLIEGSFGRTSGTKFGSGVFDSKTGFYGELQPCKLLGNHQTNEDANPICADRGGGNIDQTRERKSPSPEEQAAAGI